MRQVKPFYVKYGFQQLVDRPLRLFMTIATVKAFFGGEYTLGSGSP
jgi:hypothetical protein